MGCMDLHYSNGLHCRSSISASATYCTVVHLCTSVDILTHHCMCMHRQSSPSRYGRSKLKAWNDEFGIPDRLYFEHPTSQAAPWAVITDNVGHIFHISLNGANLVSWRNGYETELLHIREDSPADSTSPILCVPSPPFTHLPQVSCDMCACRHELVLAR